MRTMSEETPVERCCCFIPLRTGAILLAVVCAILGIIALLSALRVVDFPTPHFKGDFKIAVIAVLDCLIIVLAVYLLVVFCAPLKPYFLVPYLVLGMLTIIAVFGESMAYIWISSHFGFVVCIFLDIVLAYLWFVVFNIYMIHDKEEESRQQDQDKQQAKA